MVAMLPTMFTSGLPSVTGRTGCPDRAVLDPGATGDDGRGRRYRTCSVRLRGEADVNRGEQREDVRLEHRDEDLEEGEREGRAEGQDPEPLHQPTRLDEQVAGHREEHDLSLI